MSDLTYRSYRMSPRDKPLVWLRGEGRIMYHIAPDAIVILDVFPKKTAATPKSVTTECHKRVAEFQRVVNSQKGASRARR